MNTSFWVSVCKLWVTSQAVNNIYIFAGFFCDFKVIVWKSYSKCSNVNSDKTEFRSKDNTEISAVTNFSLRSSHI